MTTERKPAQQSDWWCMPCGAPYLFHGQCVWCGGNLARAARLRIQLGTRIRYIASASRVNGTGRAAHLAGFACFGDRRLKDPGTRSAIRQDIQGYSIDAPDEMPAGACYWVPVPEAGDPDDGYVGQQVVYREGAPHEPA